MLLTSLSALLVHFSTAIAASCWKSTQCTGPVRPSFKGPWEENLFAPHERRVRPKSVLSLPDGDFIASYDGYGSNSLLEGNNSAIVFDFGFEVGGLVEVNYSVSGSPASLGLAFTESKLWVGQSSDNSNGADGPDLALTVHVEEGDPGTYTMPDEKLRGGFRYLTLFLHTEASTKLEIHDVELEIAFQPTWPDLRAYQGYFHSDDEEMNRIWYSGAWTLRSNAIPSDTGRHSTNLTSGWENADVAGVGSTVLVDGAKRDRWIWPGDMGVAVPSAFVSTGDMESVRNALQTMYSNQDSSGELPFSGPPWVGMGSDTYHMWSIIGSYNYILYTNDREFLDENWAGMVRAVDFVTNKVQPSGLMNATGMNDWARYVNAANGSAPNMLLYHTLKRASWLFNLTDVNLAAEYDAQATDLAEAILEHLWDEIKGAFVDTPVHRDLYPQDANSMAVAFGVVPPGSEKAKSISTYLTENWTPIGPLSPELPRNISPFISSIEIEAHFRAGRPDRALDLIKTCWGWYLNNPYGTQSTMIEGYLEDGTFGYRDTRGYRNDSSYTSHAHGWSSGPTSTLTEYLVGLRVTAPAGAEWLLKPAFEGVKSAEAGFTTKLGKFQAKWHIEGSDATVEWKAPCGTKGFVEIPGAEGRWVKGGSGSFTMSLAPS